MYHVITIGSATQDVYVFSKKFRVVKDKKTITGESECFTFGTKIELDDILYEIGGGATNTAYTFSRQGLRVGCLARIGKDGAGDEVGKFLRRAKIADLLVLDKKQRTAHSVIFLAEDGKRTILVYRGAARKFKTSDIKLATIKNTKWLYITSVGGNIVLLKKIMNFAKKERINIFLNPGKLEINKSKQQLCKLIKKGDILLLNREEAANLTGCSINNIKEILKMIAKTCPGIVLITLGSKGFYYILNGVYYRAVIKPVKAVDTTGAGDAFGSGFLAGYIKNRGNLKKALMLAVSNANAVITKIGAKHGLLRRGNVIKKVPLSVKKLR